MKVAIMTQPLGANYGGIMQAWALQQVLKGAGHEPVTIDRRSDAKGLIYNAARLSYRTLQKMLGKRQAPVNFERYLPYIQKNTQAFIAQHLSMSELLDSTAKLKAHFEREDYDAVIVGSDQTWRPRYSPNIENYFLDFLQGCEMARISYASSFGVDCWEFNKAQTKRCAKLAKLFDAISVREDSGIELCRIHLGVDAEHVLDPTMLMDRGDYEQLIGLQRLRKQHEGMFVYFLDGTFEKNYLADKLGEEIGESVFGYGSDILDDNYALIDMGRNVMPDPRDWLAGFANSKFVLTDSFHGVIFSILFNKSFLVVDNKARGSARMDSLLRSFSVSERLLEHADVGAAVSLINKEIDYSRLHSYLDVARNRSNRFIRLNIFGENDA
tara:strand:- start:2335 stop:3483 length:1149 start_codon:yes stop_codon:yes gene_type:complete